MYSIYEFCKELNENSFTSQERSNEIVMGLFTEQVNYYHEN